jgi:NAD+ kinase
VTMPAEHAGHTEPQRQVLLVTHLGRALATRAARVAVDGLTAAGIHVRMPQHEAVALGMDDVESVAAGPEAAVGCELVVVLGGDGTILRGAELARGSSAALLGVSLGHVGFLAEAEEEDLVTVVDRIVARDYEVEERLTIEVAVMRDGAVTCNWAVNEASVEKRSRERMLDVMVEVDGRPLSRWGADGVILATPTGSTAYAFSAGGPVVWPEVRALLLVPLSAHALYSRPMVVSPDSVLAVELLADSPPGVLWCDGRRPQDLQPGDRVEVRRSAEPLRLARLQHPPFTDRLVRKFDLPVAGWRRGGRESGSGDAEAGQER